MVDRLVSVGDDFNIPPSVHVPADRIPDLDMDAVPDTAARFAMTAAQVAKLAAIQAGATANDTDANLKNRANHTGTQSSSTISDFTEAAQDAVAALLAAGTAVTLTYSDATNTLTVASTGGGSLDAEAVRDAIGIAMVGAGLISIVVNDAADTITVSTTATANDTDANLKNRANHTGLLPLAAAPATSVFATSGTTRPSARTDISYIFTDADPGSAALDGLDLWLDA